jgi:D-threo-aldose 1-dehydrogenase
MVFPASRAMNRRPLGHTGVEVTELGFGGGPIGNLYRAVDDDVAARTVEAAWAAGVRYFDTAPHYGLGLSEVRLGAALSGQPRDEFVVSTKVGRLLVANPQPTGTDLSNAFDVPDTFSRVRDYTADGVMRSIDASRQRLALDRIDIALIHDPEGDMDAAVGLAVPALVSLRDRAVVGAIGVGANTIDALERFVRETDIDVIMLAGRWTLLERGAAGLLDLCVERQVSVLAAAPFNSGLLAQPWPPDDAPYNYGPAPAELLGRVREMAQACGVHGDVLPHAALRFPLRHPAVVGVVVGMATPEQAATNASWATTPVADGLWHDLDRLALV